MALRDVLLPLLSLLLACAWLQAALVPTGAGQAEEAESPLHPQNASDSSTSPESLVMRLAQNAGSEHSGNSNNPAGEERHHYHSTDSSPSQSSLTCTAQCPQCPSCPAQMCPSPCPPVPTCPEPHVCPAPCKTCPTCPTCKRHIPPGYEHFAGIGYYRLHTVPVTWMEAKATCEREGAHLAIINSEDEADLMKKLFHRESDIGKWLYLGFHDLYKEGRYVTLFGEPLESTGYTIWNPHQPDNNNNNEDCGSMYPSGGLNDLDCSYKQPFVCELPV